MSKIKTTFATLAFVAACALVAAGFAAHAGAQQDTTTGTTQNTNTNAGGNTNMGGTQNASGGMGARGSALASSDRKFMQEAAAGGMAEVEMSRVAVERASSEAVREYARKMIEDHTAANQELMQLASSKGVTLPAGVDAKHRSMLTKLGGLSGAEFDREYIRNAGIRSHERMLKLVQGHARKGRDADARAFAAKMVPAVQMHLDMARQLNAGGAGAGHTGHSNGNTNSNMR
ncbi:MAG TPA: DUF4142 domain-containing protein [Pyrinomonadaceae bacterium]|nr:DUF4142 domain-containing protein [Pyrinomonadaceae bacterium]